MLTPLLHSHPHWSEFQQITKTILFTESLSPLSTEDMTRLQELMYRFHYAQMAQLQKIENDMKPKSRNGVVYKDVIRITNFSKVHKFPMKTAQDIERLENDLLNVDTLNEFVSSFFFSKNEIEHK